MTFEEYEKLLHKAAASGYAKLDIPGRTRENDPIYTLTITDFSVHEDEKFNLLITGMHVGGERAALQAFVEAIKFLLRKSSQKYLKKFTITMMPAVNPYGCFRTDIDQYAKNSAGFDVYTGQWGKSFNYPDLTLTDPEHEPELATFCKVVDMIKPEIQLDWHGANNHPNETMRQSIGASGSNSLLMPWATRLLAAMRKEVNKGKSAVFDFEEYLEHIPFTPELRQMYPNRVRTSSPYFYPDLYGYIKYHTMPVLLEIGRPEMGWRALKGLLDYALKMPPEYRGSLPVDHVGVDMANIVIASYGRNPGERRRSRVELQSKIDHCLPYHLGWMFIGRIGGGVAIGNAGVKRMTGDLPLHEVVSHDAREFPAADIPGKKNIKAFLDRGRERRFTPMSGNIAYQEMPGDTDPIKNGVTLQHFIPVGHRYKIRMTTVMVNGMKLKESTEDGYELIRGGDGWHLFLNLPPKRTKNENIFHVLAEYEFVK